MSQDRWTYGELLRMEFPPLKYIVDGILPVGLGLLGGRPKVKKSWAALQLSLAVASGEDFLGKKTERNSVLYYCLEDSTRRIQGRINLLRFCDRNNLENLPLEFRPEITPINLPGDFSGMQELRDIVSQKIFRVIIIDTLARAFSGKVDWNDLGSVTNYLAPIQKLALDNEIAIVFVDHMKKPGQQGSAEDVIDDILGSTGKTAVLDTVWGIYGKRGESGALLRITGRDVEEQDIAMRFDITDGGWVNMMDVREFIKTGTDREILEVLKDSPSGMTVAELAKTLDKDRSNMNGYLLRLEKERLLIKETIQTGKRGGYVVVWKVI